GYITLSLAQQPAAGTLQIEWATARTTTNTSGGSVTNTNAIKNTGVTYTTRSVPEYREPESTSGSTGSDFVNWPQVS
ncbi:hypothetical protein, partial [Pseudomonas sp. FW306-02-F08-AA]